MKSLNLGLMFLLEICTYVAVAMGTWQLPQAFNMVTTVGAVLVMAFVWRAFGAPKARWPSHGVPRIVLEVVWFGAGLLALLATGHPRLAAVFGALVVVNGALRALWRQSPLLPTRTSP
ncbi:MAG: YrdB family protein [Nocardioidaceae bacterium]